MGTLSLPFTLVLIFPMLLAGVGHMIIVKKDLFRGLRVPINEGLFGANKTWRGIVVMSLLTVGAMLIIDGLDRLALIDAGVLKTVNPVFSGFLLGLAYVVFELPNSWLKRRLKIPPGKLPEKHRWVFFILDHTDSAIGCLLVYRILFGFTVVQLLTILVLGIVIHTGVNLALYALKIRKNPF